jgi:L-lactate utilization protein LutB
MTFEEVGNWHNLKTLERVKENLEKRDFEAVILSDRDAVQKFVNEKIPKDKTVGMPGSATLRELEIDSYLKKRGNILYDHWDAGLSDAERFDMRKKQLQADFLLTSANALTMDGQILNIDGIGNRVASMIFGPTHVISFVGINKLARNLDEALWRIKNVATPRNAKRLGLETPCVKTGYCVDCKANTSICRVTTIIDYRPSITQFTVALMPIELGF